MQTTASRSVAAPAARKSGGSSNGGGPKSGKKKKTFEKVKATSGKELPAAAGPRPVTPAPVSGPWGNPKPVTSSAPPGFNSSAASPPPTRGFSDAHQRLLRHRALFAFRFLVGKAVELQLSGSGARYAGVLDCVDPDDFSMVLKSAKQLSAGAEAGEPFESGSTVIFQRSQVAHLVADGSVNYTDGVVGAGGASVAGGFRTDTEISGRQGDHLYGRELQTATSWLDPALDSGELEDASSNGRRHSKNQGKAGWNQFEANEKLFGVVSTFDENIYTTKLDKSKISTEQSRAAERLAQEIERQASAGNFHLQEERGQTARGGKHVNNDLDEEARYSSVDRKASSNSGGNAYVPPALRNAQRQSSGGKAQGTKTPPASAPVVVAAAAAPAVAPGPAAEVTPASPVAPAAPKPLSFSDAVTGRSATTATAKTPASTPKLEPDTKKGAAGSPQKAAETAPVKSKEAKPAASAVSASSKAKAPELPEKKTSSGKDRKTESAADSKSTSSSTTATTASTTTTTTTTQSKAKPAAAPKKGLNPNAKEFKLSASAVEFTPRFATPPAVKEVVTSPYRGGSPGNMPYQGGGGYPPEEWMYDGGGEEGAKMGMLPYMQGGYAIPMAPNGVPMMPQQMYPPMMPQQNMRMMGGHRSQGNYGGYQQQPYNPRGYYLASGGYPSGGVPYPGGAGGVPGGVGPQPPLPREPTPSDVAPTDSSPAPPAPEAAAEVGSAPPSSSKQAASPSKKK